MVNIETSKFFYRLILVSFLFFITPYSASGFTDSYEENDSIDTASLISESSDLSSLYADDYDFYKIWVDIGDTIIAIISFEHINGDLEVQLYNTSQILIDTSFSTSNSEEVSYTATSSGYHYIHVFPYDGTINANSYSMSVNASGLAPPTNVDASVTNCSSLFGTDSCTVSLTWSVASGVTGYNLYYGTMSGVYINESSPVDLGNVSSFSFSGVPFGTYYIVITAYTSLSGTISESPKSSELKIVSGIEPPANFVGSGSSGTVNFSWDAASGAAGYYLYYGIQSGIYLNKSSPSNLGNATSVTFTDIPDGTFYLALTAYNGTNDETSFSNELECIFTSGGISSDSSVSCN